MSKIASLGSISSFLYFKPTSEALGLMHGRHVGSDEDRFPALLLCLPRVSLCSPNCPPTNSPFSCLRSLGCWHVLPHTRFFRSPQPGHSLGVLNPISDSYSSCPSTVSSFPLFQQQKVLDSLVLTLRLSLPSVLDV